MPRTLIILNPHSGSHSEKAQELIQARMTTTEHPFEIRLTQHKEDAFEWGQQAKSEGFERIFVGGGDGTICDTINGLMSGGVIPLGVLPLGTANGLARFLEVPLEIEKALEVALQDHIIQIDLGYVKNHDRHFVLFAGAGWDAETIAQASRQAKKRFGGLAYIWAAQKSLRQHDNQIMTLTLDKQSYRLKGYSVVIFSASDFQIAGISTIKSDPSDGKFDVFVLKNPSLWNVMSAVGKLILQNRQSEHLRHFRAAQVRIQPQRSLKTQIDGDVIGETPLELVVKPRVLPLLSAASLQEKAVDKPPE